MALILKLIILASSLILVTVSSTGGSVVQQNECPAGFESHIGYCFLDHEYLVTYDEAVDLCNGLDTAASLPYPTGYLESWHAAIDEVYNSGNWRHAGATHQEGGVWRWPDGSEVPAEAWDSRHPSGLGNCSGICTDNGRLCDSKCSSKTYTLCQAAEATTTTGTTQITEVSTTTTEGFQTTFTTEILTTTIECPESFESHVGYCFLDHEYLVTYVEAIDFCLGLDAAASLPYPTGDLETWQAAIDEVYNTGYWRHAGATLQEGGVWRWPDGSEVPAEAWDSRYPSGWGNCSGICSDNGRLCDSTCSSKAYTLCQAAEATTTTGTTHITEVSTTTTERFQTTLTTEILTTTTVCSDGFGMYEEYCILDNDNYITYNEALDFCSRLNATASLPYPIGDIGTWQAAVGEARHGHTHWSSATLHAGGVWRWPDGTEVPAIAWLGGHPTGAPCSHVCTDTGRLCDTSCTGRRYTLCQATETTTTTETHQTTNTTGLTTSTTEHYQTTLTMEVPTTTTGTKAECYSCLGCPDVAFNTHTEAKEPNQSCFTAIYGNEHNVVRGLSPQLHHEGECEVVDHVLFCYCNYSRCNGEHVFKHLTQNIDF